MADWIALTWPAISSVAFAVWLASSLTSDPFGRGGEAADHLRGLSGLDHGAVGDVAGMAHLAADLGDRRGEFFGGGGHGADAGRGLLGSRCRGRGLLRGAIDAGGDLAGHALHVPGGLRDRANHAFDISFEAIGHLPLQCLLLPFGLSLGGVLGFAQGTCFDHAAAEHVDRHRHGAQLVLPLAAGNGHIGIAAGETIHYRGDRRQRTRHAAAEQERQ